jgi:hypothetical protein
MYHEALKKLMGLGVLAPLLPAKAIDQQQDHFGGSSVVTDGALDHLPDGILGLSDA